MLWGKAWGWSLREEGLLGWTGVSACVCVGEMEEKEQQGGSGSREGGRGCRRE